MSINSSTENSNTEKKTSEDSNMDNSSVGSEHINVKVVSAVHSFDFITNSFS